MIKKDKDFNGYKTRKTIIMIILDVVLSTILIIGIVNNIELLTKLALIAVVTNCALLSIGMRLKNYKEQISNKYDPSDLIKP